MWEKERNALARYPLYQKVRNWGDNLHELRWPITGLEKWKVESFLCCFEISYFSLVGEGGEEEDFEALLLLAWANVSAGALAKNLQLINVYFEVNSS
jgi:hypothetical protein